MEKSQSEEPKHNFDDNIDFMTTNTFYQGLTKNSEDNQIGTKYSFLYDLNKFS